MIFRPLIAEPALTPCGSNFRPKEGKGAKPPDLGVSANPVSAYTPGAMPVGWRLPFEERPFKPAAPTVSQLLALIATRGLLFALIALLPEFDGSRGGAWDKQEGDG